MAVVNQSFITFSSQQEQAQKAHCFLQAIRSPFRFLAKEQREAILAAGQEAFKNIYQQFSAFERSRWQTLTNRQIVPNPEWPKPWQDYFKGEQQLYLQQRVNMGQLPNYNLFKRHCVDFIQKLEELEPYKNFNVTLDNKTYSGAELFSNLLYSFLNAIQGFNKLLIQDNWQQDLPHIRDLFNALVKDSRQLSRVQISTGFQESIQKVLQAAERLNSCFDAQYGEEVLNLFLVPFQDHLAKDAENYFDQDNVDNFDSFVYFCEIVIKEYCTKYEKQLSKIKASIRRNEKLQTDAPQLQRSLVRVLQQDEEILEDLQKALNYLQRLHSSSDVAVSLEKYLPSNLDFDKVAFSACLKNIIEALTNLKEHSQVFFATYYPIEQRLAKSADSSFCSGQVHPVAKLVNDFDKNFRSDFVTYCASAVHLLQEQSDVLTDNSLAYFNGVVSSISSLGLNPSKKEHYQGFCQFDFFVSHWLQLLQNIHESLDPNNVAQKQKLLELFSLTLICFNTINIELYEDRNTAIEYCNNLNLSLIDILEKILKKIEELQTPAASELSHFIDIFIRCLKEYPMLILVMLDKVGNKSKIDQDLEFVRTFLKQYKVAISYMPTPNRALIGEVVKCLESAGNLDVKEHLLQCMHDVEQLINDMQSMAKNLDCNHSVKQAIFVLTSHPAMQRYDDIIDALVDITDELIFALTDAKASEVDSYFIDFRFSLEAFTGMLNFIHCWADEQDDSLWDSYLLPASASATRIEEVSSIAEPEEKEKSAPIQPVPSVHPEPISVVPTDRVLKLTACLHKVKIILQEQTSPGVTEEIDRLLCMQSAVGNMECYAVVMAEVLNWHNLSKICSSAIALHLKNAMLLEQLFKMIIAHLPIKNASMKHVFDEYKHEHDLQKLFNAVKSELQNRNIPISAEMEHIISFLKDMSTKTSRHPLTSISSDSVFKDLQMLSDCYDAMQHNVAFSSLQNSWLQEKFPNVPSSAYPQLVRLNIEERFERLQKQTQQVIDFAIDILEKIPFTEKKEGINQTLVVRQDHLASVPTSYAPVVRLNALQQILFLIQHLAAKQAARKKKIMPLEGEDDKECRERKKIVTDAIITIPFCVTALRELYSTANPSAFEAESKLFFEALLLEKVSLLIMAYLPIAGDRDATQHVLFTKPYENRTLAVSHEIEKLLEMINKHLQTQSKLASWQFKLQSPQRISELRHAFTVSCRYPFDDEYAIGTPLNQLRRLGFLRYRSLQNMLLPTEHQLLLDSFGPNEDTWDSSLQTKQENLQNGLEKGIEQTFNLVQHLLSLMKFLQHSK